MPIKYDYLSKFEYKFMSCIPSKFLNFGIVIYYTAKSRSPIYFIYLFIYLFWAKWVIKWEKKNTTIESKLINFKKITIFDLLLLLLYK